MSYDQQHRTKANPTINVVGDNTERKSYSILLKTEGLTYQETDRMFSAYEEYLRLQPNADDADKIREYVERKKKRRPTSNVLKWIDL